MPSWQNQRLGSFSSDNLVFPVQIYLLHYDTGAKRLEPWVASSWTKNDENIEFTFTIRPGITFSDGTQLTPEAVARNFDVFGHGDEKRRIPVHAQLSRGYDHAEVDGDKVRIVLSAPNQQFLVDTTRINSGLVAARTLDLEFEEAGIPKNVISAGPFVFESQVPNQQVTLRRREDFTWGQPSSPNKGAAYLEKIIWRVLPEVGLRTGALRSGQVDVVRSIQPSDEEALLAEGYRILAPQPPLGAVNAANFRISNPLVSDERVRRALRIGTNLRGLQETALTPRYLVSTSLLHTANPNHSDLSGLFAFDLTRARALLDEAGWAQGPDGVRARDGRCA
ncbi:ABC transporter substrate-binding protein [Protofrankia coriariae]|uniref:Solute-binding protein family 5 domain-containing protein n=1 Tax=Protofrankia coriariae TaxID=1562887 RepID=A0ABR5F723_9ACTN|nr:ABC transporter substrate-binding protein [Protofrankia coriariae]KLL12535.1 hypothetical protein FrCorBMG51_04620 [Protofrankia coriariae]